MYQHVSVLFRFLSVGVVKLLTVSVLIKYENKADHYSQNLSLTSPKFGHKATEKFNFI